MKVIFGIGRIRVIKRGVVALGVFDGLHLGHLRILREAIGCAKKIRGRSVVITFSPHPQSELNLYSLEHRLKLLRKIGIDICIVIRFTDSFARISPGEFIKNLLVKKIHPDYVFVGGNFSFGRHARGNPQLLEEYARRYNFRLRVFPIYKQQGKAISSTYIRQLIQGGKLKQAQTLLGRPVAILGAVIKGSSLARNLGFPTANIKADHEVLPPAGVYLVVVIYHNKKYKGICYIGGRPTLEKLSGQGIHIEVHIFGFNKDVYGKHLEIQFVKQIRKEKKFASIGLLAQGVRRDLKFAKSYFRAGKY